MAREPDPPQRISARRARQGTGRGRILTVLLTSLGLAGLAGVILYYMFYG